MTPTSTTYRVSCVVEVFAENERTARMLVGCLIDEVDYVRSVEVDGVQPKVSKEAARELLTEVDATWAAYKAALGADASRAAMEAHVTAMHKLCGALSYYAGKYETVGA